MINLAVNLAVLPLLAMAASDPPPVEDLLGKYDAIISPENFDSVTEMVANRDDGSTRRYRMRALKSGSQKLRLWFTEPAAIKGQEMLRQGENLWVYLPNLKRPMRLASRESFQGGDFNNADVLRASYRTDYQGKVKPDGARADLWELDLTAKSPDAAYDRVRLWLQRSDGMPVKGEYYSSSGKLLRVAEFTEVKSFNGFKRPSKILMKNMVATKRSSMMIILSLEVKVQPAAGKFVLDDLGR